MTGQLAHEVDFLARLGVIAGEYAESLQSPGSSTNPSPPSRS